MQIIQRAIFPELLNALGDRRVIVITGMRRTGKTTALRWLLDQVPSSNKIYLDLERLDQRAVFQENNYDLILGYLRNRGLDLSQPLTVALDEIQYVPNLPGAVKYLYDHAGIKFLLTGSSSFYLKHYFSQSMAGRKVVFELFPLGFGEFLDFRQVPYRPRPNFQEMRFDPFEYERLKDLYEEYTAYGGLPDIALEPRPQVKREILLDIYSSYINIDVRAMADFKKIGALQQLLSLLALRVANRLDNTKLGQLVGVSRATVSEFLDFLEMTYVIHRLPAYAGPDRAAALAPARKLYFCDIGIAGVLAQPGEGALFENAVYNQLRPYGALAYLSKANQYEVDFVLTPPAGETAAFEVKYHPLESDSARLRRIALAQGIGQCWVIGKYPSPGHTDFIWGGLIF